MKVLVIAFALVVVTAYDCGYQTGRNEETIGEDDDDVYEEEEDVLDPEQMARFWNVHAVSVTSNSPQVIMTPGFPLKSPNDARISWEITTTGGTLTAHFDVFQLRINRKCSQDWVKIIDGLSLNEKLCGCHLNMTYTTTSTSLKIYLKTSSRYQQRGFNCTLSVA